MNYPNGIGLNYVNFGIASGWDAPSPDQVIELLEEAMRKRGHEEVDPDAPLIED